MIGEIILRLQKMKRIFAGVLIASVVCGVPSYGAEEAIAENSVYERIDSAQEDLEQSEETDTEEESVEYDAEENEQESSYEDETMLMEEEAVQMDVRTQKLYEEYWNSLSELDTCAVGTYDAELAKFPVSYQLYLKQLHSSHPNWIFVAVPKSLDWNDIVKAESVSGSSSGLNRSLLPNSCQGILLSKASTDYSVTKGSYIAKDGSTWVSASKPAVAYYVDPRNFLTDQYIFMFEALDFNESYHNLSGVSNALKGTELYNKQISYINTSGKAVSVDMSYDKAILAAGKTNKVSPLFLAAKIRQETGGKLSNGSICGTTKGYVGYYNFYNIGAYSSSQGSAVLNGLYYAKGGSSGSKTYGRPWTSPILSIDGGAKFLASSYIAKGQNTIYFQKFNTAVAPYYQHQYMQNLTAAASEAKTTCNSYKSMGILEDAFVFYIHVYQNMPEQTSTVSIQKSVNTGKTTTSVTLRKGPSANSESLGTVTKGKTVTVSGAVYTDMSESVTNQEKNPFWYKVTYGSKIGYISSRYIEMDTDSTIKAGGTKQLNVSCSGAAERIYYETSDPAVATVSDTGKIKGVKNGKCEVYAVTSSGKCMDVIGITVSGKVSNTGLSTPKLVSVSNSASGVVIKWAKVSKAKGYYIYRKTPGGSWKSIKKVTSGSTVKYTDKTMKAGRKYVYSVRAYSGSKKSSYDKKGLTIRRLRNPDLRSTVSSKNAIKVRWNKVKGAVSYEVYRKQSGGKFVKIAEVKGGSTLSYTDRTAEKNVTYRYTVRARSGIYKGSYHKTGVKGKIK